MRKVIYMFIWVVGFQLLFLGSVYSYQIELDYYTARTQDTVTPAGIYHEMFLYINAPVATIDKIDYVKYQFTGKFWKPELISRSREHDFQVEVKSLSHFSATALVHFKNGKKLELDRYIMAGIQKPKRKSAHVVFLNHIPEEVPTIVKGKKVFNVAMFIDGSRSELGQISRIEYYFEPSSKRKPIIINNPKPDSQVQLRLSEQLNVQAYVYFRDGSVSHHIRFIYFKYY